MEATLADELADIILRYGSSYGPVAVLVVSLSALTVFRREMSCNHVYAEEDNEMNNKRNPSTETSFSSGISIVWDEKETEELLDGAGCYCSGALLSQTAAAIIAIFYSSGGPLLMALWHASLSISRSSSSSSSGIPPTPLPTLETEHARRGEDETCDNETTCDSTTASDSASPSLFAGSLPPDAEVNIMSFLHPKDVVNVSSVCKASKGLVDGEGPSTMALWKTLWYRDYAWVVQAWDVGRQALERSYSRRTRGDGDILRSHEPSFSKDFYFRFGLSYLNYTLAGQNTMERCLVGLDGHIYDMSGFISVHPGSPETAMVQAGRDATAFFRNVRHSMGALRRARSMCVVVDRSKLDPSQCGLKRTSHTAFCPQADQVAQLMLGEYPPMEAQSSSTLISTLESVWNDFRQQEEESQRQATRRSEGVSTITEITTFYDPFLQEWQAWYTDTDMETVFLEQL